MLSILTKWRILSISQGRLLVDYLSINHRDRRHWLIILRRCRSFQMLFFSFTIMKIIDYVIIIQRTRSHLYDRFKHGFKSKDLQIGKGCFIFRIKIVKFISTIYLISFLFPNVIYLQQSFSVCWIIRFNLKKNWTCQWLLAI